MGLAVACCLLAASHTLVADAGDESRELKLETLDEILASAAWLVRRAPPSQDRTALEAEQLTAIIAYVDSELGRGKIDALLAITYRSYFVPTPDSEQLPGLSLVPRRFARSSYLTMICDSIARTEMNATTREVATLLLTTLLDSSDRAEPRCAGAANRVSIYPNDNESAARRLLALARGGSAQARLWTQLLQWLEGSTHEVRADVRGLRVSTPGTKTYHVDGVNGNPTLIYRLSATCSLDKEQGGCWSWFPESFFRRLRDDGYSVTAGEDYSLPGWKRQIFTIRRKSVHRRLLDEEEVNPARTMGYRTLYFLEPSQPILRRHGER